MLKKKKLVFALFLFTCLFLSMSFASANNITDIDDSNNNETIVENHSTKSFTDLNNLINDFNQTEIILEDDYIYQEEYDKDFTEGISINRSVTIDGNGHVIDVNKSSRIFYINASCITLKNITFKNGDSSFGGAIYCNGLNMTIDNCIFINNGAVSGGAIYCNALNMTIDNCIFINNGAVGTGGAIYSEASNTKIIDSTFMGSCVSFYGGAIHCIGLNTTIINSTFINNFIANMAGGSAIALSNGFIIDSTFINNYQVKRDTGIYYYDLILNVVNESISSDNNGKVWDVVRSENVTIINSTFRNTPTHEIHYNQTFFFIWGNDTDNNTNQSNNNSTDKINKITPVNTYKSSSIIVAKNKVFQKKLKTKRYAVFLKSNNGKVLKNTWITLKIKGKLFKAKTNNKGKATFKITKLYKKGNFKAVVKFKGSKKYKSSYKKVNIKIK